MNRFNREMTAAMVLYAAVLLASQFALLNLQDANVYLRGVIVLMPMIPVGLFCWTVVRDMRRLDEMYLRIQFEALGFAFAASALLTFTYGFLETVGAPHIPWLYVWPVMGLMWMIGLRIARHRYQ
ncbi:hypothetical protein [Pseudomonas kribbensis]|uniref:Uncharacterized protein n=1 Tax=Pseudomonas kribbensis TaxID=1628086 RepID=A0A4Y8VGQ2_9PSED|nr:hypothetical protein [Pseudomonas kribbensis]TFH79447.1 hypothetical protein E4J90_16640 [Pseudomonas kribbensis]